MGFLRIFLPTYLGILKKLSRGKGYGKNRLIRKIQNSIEGSFRASEVIVHGHKMHLPKKGFHEYSVYGIYGELDTIMVEKLVKNEDVVVDVGAAIGYYTLILARAVGNKGTVIAFEPKEGRFEILENNIKLNGYDNVIAENKAIMLDGQGKKFFVHDDNTAGYRFITNRSDDNLTKKFSKPVDVLTTDLDVYLTDLGIIDKVSFMKIDVDGPELLVLQSGRQLLKNRNLNILLEWDQDAAKWSNCSPESIIDILLENGFEIYYPDYIKKKYFHITKERLLNIDPLDDVINILCVKDKSILEDNELLT
tara:strand:- start:1272 stop:2192 length:921 start_codon:yes stop_codon:yes gene_type:complete